MCTHSAGQCSRGFARTVPFLMILVRRTITEPRGIGVFDYVDSSPRCNHLSLLSPSPCLCPRQVYSTNACVVLSFSLFYYLIYSLLFLYLHTPKSKRAMKSPQRHFPSLSFDFYPASHQEPYLKPLNPPPRCLSWSPGSTIRFRNAYHARS